MYGELLAWVFGFVMGFLFCHIFRENFAGVEKWGKIGRDRAEGRTQFRSPPLVTVWYYIPFIILLLRYIVFIFIFSLGDNFLLFIKITLAENHNLRFGFVVFFFS